MPNIKFSYLYRDGANYKNYHSIIFDNSHNVDLVELEALIRSKLIDGIWFYVNEWKLPDLHFATWDDEIDHTWHEFERVEYSDELLNIPLNLKEFITTIEKTSWHIKYLITSPLNKNSLYELFSGFERLSEKAKDFSNELTYHNTIEKNLNKRDQILEEYTSNNKAIGDLLLKRGVKPKAQH